MTNDKTIEVLKAATQDIRAEYVARYTEMMMARLIQDRAELAKVGMDAEIYAPYPGGFMSRANYRAAEAKYRRVRCYFADISTACCRRPHDPCIVAERPEAEPRLRAAARLEADGLVDSYLFKLAGKIAKEAVSCTTNGNIWDCATLTVTCADGEIQVWRTNCILNQSVYGKLFNQWPTRRQKKPLDV